MRRLLARSPVILAGVDTTPDAELIRYGAALARERGMNDAGVQMAVSQGWAESSLGARKPFLLPNGEPSWNWGATTARNGVPYFGGGDTDASGKPIKQRWARWSNMAEGLDYWLSFGSVKAGLGALQEGDAMTYSAIIFDRGYYTGNNCDRETCIRRYAAWLVSTAKNKVAPALAQPVLINASSPVPASTGTVKPQQLASGASSGAGMVAMVVGGLGALYVARKVFL